MTINNKNPTINILILLLLVLLTIAGVISYKSIDWEVLKTMEAKKLILPTTTQTTIIPSDTQK